MLCHGRRAESESEMGNLGVSGHLMHEPRMQSDSHKVGYV